MYSEARRRTVCWTHYVIRQQEIRVIFWVFCKSLIIFQKSNVFLNYLRYIISIESWPITSGRFGKKSHWEWVLTEKVCTKLRNRTLQVVLPLSNKSCIDYRNTQCRAAYFRKDYIGYMPNFYVSVSLLEKCFFLSFIDVNINYVSVIK